MQNFLKKKPYKLGSTKQKQNQFETDVLLSFDCYQILAGYNYHLNDFKNVPVHIATTCTIISASLISLAGNPNQCYVYKTKTQQKYTFKSCFVMISCCNLAYIEQAYVKTFKCRLEFL